MKRVFVVAELDLGVFGDDYKVTQERIESELEIGDTVAVSYQIHEIYSQDVDTHLMIDQIVTPVEDDE
jgi:hypothetical protein